MNKKNRSDDLEQFDMGRLLFEFLKRKYIVAGLIIVCAVATFLYTEFIYTPMYTSCAKIYIFNSAADKLSTTEIAVSTYLTKDYSELIMDRSVLDEANKQLGYDYTYGELKNAITVKNPEDSRILEVYATTSNPERSQQIADRVCEVAQQKIVDLMGVDRVNIISEAYLPLTPSEPNLLTNMFLGITVGVCLSIFIVFVCYFRNDKLHSEEDIVKHLDICVLGTIPYSKNKGGRRVAR